MFPTPTSLSSTSSNKRRATKHLEPEKERIKKPKTVTELTAGLANIGVQSVDKLRCKPKRHKLLTPKSRSKRDTITPKYFQIESAKNLADNLNLKWQKSEFLVMCETWINDIQSEKDFHQKFSIPDLNKNVQANAANRWVCLNWIRDVAFQRGVNRKTFYATVQYMEYLLGECSATSDFQLLVVSAFLMASKVNVKLVNSRMPWLE